MVLVFCSLTCLSQFSECAHDNQELFHLEPKKNSNLMKIDGSSVRVTPTLKTNGYFVQLLHVSPYKDSITPNLLLAIHKALLTMRTLIPMSNQLSLLFRYRIIYIMQNKNQHIPRQSYSQPVKQHFKSRGQV